MRRLAAALRVHPGEPSSPRASSRTLALVRRMSLRRRHGAFSITTTRLMALALLVQTVC